jgi:hypothetical protein
MRALIGTWNSPQHCLKRIHLFNQVTPEYLHLEYIERKDMFGNVFDVEIRYDLLPWPIRKHLSRVAPLEELKPAHKQNFGTVTKLSDYR